MKTPITYNIIAREIEKIYDCYITDNRENYAGEDFDFDFFIGDMESVSINGTIYRKGDNLVIAIDRIDQKRLVEPMIFEYLAYDE